MFHGVLIIWMFTVCIRCNVPEVKSQSKDVLLATRVTPHISNIVKMITPAAFEHFEYLYNQIKTQNYQLNR